MQENEKEIALEELTRALKALSEKNNLALRDRALVLQAIDKIEDEKSCNNSKE